MRINFAFVLLCFILFPFFVQTFPVLSKIYWLFSAIFTPFLVIFIFRKRDKFSISFDSLLFLLISLFVVNFYFSLKSAGLHEDYVLKNAIRAFFSTLGFLSIILLGQIESIRAYILEYSTKFIVVFTCAASVIGIVKNLYISYGTDINSLFDHFVEGQVWGTSLSRDYNFFSLSLLLGAILLVGDFFSDQSYSRRTLKAFCLGLILVAGIYTGSRRFLILAPVLLPLTFAWLLFVRKKFDSQGYRVSYSKNRLQDFCGFAMPILVAIIPILFLNFLFVESAENLNALLERRLSSFSEIHNHYGMKGRLERWLYALELFYETRGFLGSGFEYHQYFGCKFLTCFSLDYPHNFVLSALLFGGIPAAILSILILLISCNFIFQGLFVTDDFTPRKVCLSVCMFVTVIYSTTSGDTLFSMPIFLCILTLLRLMFITKSTLISGASNER